MAKLLRSGATMLGEHCPACGTPIFKLRDGSLYCPSCGKPVVRGEEGGRAMAEAVKGSLDESLMAKVKEIQALLEEETDLEALNAILDTLMRLLEAREKLRKLD